MSNEVTVLVTITERVRYSALVKMPSEKFEELETALEEKHGYELRRIEEQIGEYCDRRDDWRAGTSAVAKQAGQSNAVINSTLSLLMQDGFVVKDGTIPHPGNGRAQTIWKWVKHA